MNEKLEKVSAQTNRPDIVPEQAFAPHRSLEDSKTWSELLDSIENFRYSTQTVFKVSGKHPIHANHNIEPLFLYDNIILGMSGDRLAFLFGRTFEYVRNQLLTEAINKEDYNLAKSVFGTCIAGYIFDELKRKCTKTFDVDEYCNLVQLTFKFELCQLNDAVSQWICRFINGQAGLAEAPTELRAPDFHLWKSAQPLSNAFKYQNHKGCIYSIGCFLESVI